MQDWVPLELLHEICIAAVTILLQEKVSVFCTNQMLGQLKQGQGMLTCLVKQRNLKVQIQSAPRKRFPKETNTKWAASAHLLKKLL